MPRGEDSTGINGAFTSKVEYFNKFGRNEAHFGSLRVLSVKFKSSVVTIIFTGSWRLDGCCIPVSRWPEVIIISSANNNNQYPAQYSLIQRKYTLGTIESLNVFFIS